MKTITSILTVIILMFFSTAKTSAQNFSIGAGVVYGTNINSIGISENDVYKVNKKIGIASSFLYFFESDNVSWTVINVAGHYNFLSNKGLDVYGIAGLGMTFASVTFWGQSQTESNFGAILGAGLSKSLSKEIDLFGEIKYTISNGSYFIFNAGVLYNL